MVKSITAETKQNWGLYFSIVFFAWIILSFIVFVACLPSIELGIVAIIIWTAILASPLVKIDEKMKPELIGIEPGQMGVIKCFGKIILILKSGFGFILPVPLFLRLEIYSIRERSSPLELTGIETADSSQVDWKKLGLKKEEFEDLYLGKQMKINLGFEVFWQPEEEPQEFAYYVKNIADYGGNDDRVDKKFVELAPGVAKSIVLAETNRRTPAIINFQREKISGILSDKMQTAVSHPNEPKRSWGVKITGMRLGQLDVPKDVAEKMGEMTIFEMNQYMKWKAAKTESDILVMMAKAKEFEEIYLGRGKAKAEMFMYKTKSVGEPLINTALGLSKAKVFAAIAKALNMEEPVLLMKLETMKETFKNIEKNRLFHV